MPDEFNQEINEMPLARHKVPPAQAANQPPQAKKPLMRQPPSPYPKPCLKHPQPYKPKSS